MLLAAARRRRLLKLLRLSSQLSTAKHSALFSHCTALLPDFEIIQKRTVVTNPVFVDNFL